MINKPETLKNLVARISSRTGMDDEKSLAALVAVAEHVKEEFPLLQSVVDLVLGIQGVRENKKSFVTDFSKN